MSKEINEFYWIKTVSIMLLFFIHSGMFLNQTSTMEYITHFMLSNFFFISGYLTYDSQKRGLKRFWKNRLVRIYIPFVLFLGIYQFVDWFLSYFTNEFSYISTIGPIDYLSTAALLGAFEQNIIPIFELSHLWFVPVLLAFMLLITNLERITNRLSVQICAVLALILINGFLFRSNAPVALSENFTLFIFNFAIGFWIAKTNKLDKIQQRWILPVGAAFYLLLFLTPVNIVLELQWLRYSILALSATVISLSFLSSVKGVSWIKLVASSTLMIYLSEPLIRYVVGKAFGTDFYSDSLILVVIPMFLRIVISIIVGISGQILFLKVIHKFSSYWNGKNRKQKNPRKSKLFFIFL